MTPQQIEAAIARLESMKPSQLSPVGLKQWEQERRKLERLLHESKVTK
jgi:hypothetical protein